MQTTDTNNKNSSNANKPMDAGKVFPKGDSMSNKPMAVSPGQSDKAKETGEPTGHKFSHEPAKGTGIHAEPPKAGHTPQNQGKQAEPMPHQTAKPAEKIATHK